MKKLFVFLHGIGNCILFTPALRLYKKKNPKDKVFVLVLNHAKEVFENSPYVDSVLVSKSFSTPPNFGNYFKYFLEKKELNSEIKKIIDQYGMDEAQIILPNSVLDIFGNFIDIKISIPGKIRRIPYFYKVENHEILKSCFLLGVLGNEKWPDDFSAGVVC